MKYSIGAIDRLLLIALLCAMGLAALMLWPSPSTPGTDGASAGQAAAPAPAHWVVKGAQLFDGERHWPRADVEVRDGVVVAVAESLQPDPSVAIVDGSGMTLLPGLIDAHVHIYGNAREEMLRFGVTTAIDMFSAPTQLPSYRADRQSHDNTVRADIWSAGALVTANGGHGTQFGMPISTLDRADDAETRVEERRQQGSDFIKLVVDDGHAYGLSELPTLDPERIDAVIVASHAAGLKAYAHVSAVDAANSVLQAGADGLVHVFSDRIASDAEIKTMTLRQATVIPTLSVISVMTSTPNGADLLEDPDLAPWLSAAQKQQLDSRFGAIAELDDHLGFALANTLALHRAGAVILAGTDVGNPGTSPGVSLHGELELLVRAGLTTREALATATSLPAREFGITDRGLVAVGMRADLLLVEGDPLSDIRSTRAIHRLWKNGVPVDRRAGLDQGGAGSAVALPIGSDFDAGSLTASHGQAWMETSDQIMGGGSSAALANSLPASTDGNGTLQVSGEVKSGAAYPWAGAMLMMRDPPMQPVNASSLTSIRFRSRGEPRDLTVMLFSGEERALPAMTTVAVTAEWQTHTVSLDALHGVDRQRLRALAFTAGLPAGPFVFELDDVELSDATVQ